MKEKQVTTTRREIDKVTYIVVAAPSDDARERLDVKINKLLQRDLQQGTESR